jgi:hypothetical protein
MANEAICMINPTRFGRVTIAAGAVIPKGSLIALTDPNTGAVCSADNDVFGGIAMEASTAADTFTELGVALDGVWALMATAAGITIGADVTIGGANTIKTYTTLDDEKGYVVGKALETTAGSETIMVRLNL